VEETATVFERLGAEVTLRLYPGMGHLVNDDELSVARSLMDRVAQGAG
jgi:predicted esterase